MMCQASRFVLKAVGLLLLLPSALSADPCGMVPPIYIGPGAPLVRVGLQKTYVFHRRGVETFVIRPGFSGKVDNFGMLIPFPNPPAIRKVPDNIFSQIANAIDPPEVVIDLTPRGGGFGGGGGGSFGGGRGAGGGGLVLRNQVKVINREAVGMYDVAVLEAGSAAALKRWMDQQKFQYPKGMDDVVEDYTKQRWCFAAVKTLVGDKSSVDPKPGQRQVDSKLPAGSGFEGKVQAMGFRFYSRNPVLPMRLSAFNEGDLRNVVYMLTTSPRKILNIPEEYVVRQISGKQLIKNLTQPLPVRLIGAKRISRRQLKAYASRRNPAPHSGVAGDLFIADLKSAFSKKLISESEQLEKELQNIGEHFGLRGGEYENLVSQSLQNKQQRSRVIQLAGLKTMTLSVIDGDFPRAVIARENLSFSAFNILPSRNRVEFYDSKLYGAPQKRAGVRIGQADLDRFLQQESKSQHARADAMSPTDAMIPTNAMIPTDAVVPAQRRSVLLSDYCLGLLIVGLVGLVCVRIGTFDDFGF